MMKKHISQKIKTIILKLKTEKGKKMTDAKNVKELVRLGVSIANAVGKSMEDGKFTVFDMAHFIGVLAKVPAAIADLDQVPVEIKSIDDAEYLALVEEFKKDLDLPQDAAEQVIEMGFEVGLAILKLAGKLVP